MEHALRENHAVNPRFLHGAGQGVAALIVLVIPAYAGTQTVNRHAAGQA